MRQMIAIALCISTGAVNVFAWGKEGHAVIAAVAESRLSDTTKAAVRKLLAGKSMASVASWADTVRYEAAFAYTYNWHFVDIPKSVDSFSESRDCYLPNDKHPGAKTDHQNCVVDRITYFEQALMNKQGNQQQALEFLIHFVGDAHQPFHAMGDEEGGNLIHITLFGSQDCGTGDKKEACNLHSAWDDGLIEHTGRTQQQYTSYVAGLIAKGGLDSSGTPEGWANAAHKLAQAAWVDQGGMIDQTYYDHQIGVVDQQLALAAMRLTDAIENSVGAGATAAAKTKGKPKRSAN